jgi:hypothetical protein
VFGPDSTEDEQPSAGQAGEEREHETSGAAVQPLEIVEEHDERSVDGECAESGVQLAQHTSASGIAGGAFIEDVEKSRRTGAEGAPLRASLQPCLHVAAKRQLQWVVGPRVPYIQTRAGENLRSVSMGPLAELREKP